MTQRGQDDDDDFLGLIYLVYNAGSTGHFIFVKSSEPATEGCNSSSIDWTSCGVRR